MRPGLTASRTSMWRMQAVLLHKHLDFQHKWDLGDPDHPQFVRPGNINKDVHHQKTSACLCSLSLKSFCCLRDLRSSCRCFVVATRCYSLLVTLCTQTTAGVNGTCHWCWFYSRCSRKDCLLQIYRCFLFFWKKGNNYFG